MHVRRSLGRHLAGALTAPVFVLAACGGGDSVADPPVSSPPTSSPTQPPKHESPEAFIRRWAETEKRMENTGAVRPYLAISSRCKACRELANDIRRYYGNGGFVHWKGWTIESIVKSTASPGEGTYVVTVNSGPTTYERSANGAVQHLAGGGSTHQLTIGQINGSWQMLVKAQLES